MAESNSAGAANSIEQILQRKVVTNKFDKILAKMCSTYMKLSLSDDNTSQEYAANTKELLEDIQQLEFQTFKYETALRSIAKDNQSVENELVKTKQKIEQTNEQIIAMKEQLKTQEIIKKNKQEYNVLASEVKQYDSKSEMLKKIQEVEKEIETLNQNHQLELANIAKQENYLRTMLSSLTSLINSTGQN